MSRKLVYTAEVASAQNLGASFDSNPIKIQYLDNVGIQCNFSGSPVGTLSIQVSADYQQDLQGNVINAGHWVTLQSTSTALTVGSPIYFDLTQLSAPWVRVDFVRTSGTGSMDIWCYAKEI